MSLRTQLTFRKLEEEDFEEAEKCAKFRRKLLEDYSDIFKETLGPEDRLDSPSED